MNVALNKVLKSNFSVKRCTSRAFSSKYEMCDVNEVPVEESDHFKSAFKKLKRKVPPPDYSNVIDFDNSKDASVRLISERNLTSRDSRENCDKLGLIAHSSWRIYALDSVPGFVFVSNPFTKRGQRYWIRNCLQNYAEYPNLTNLHSDLKRPPEAKYRNLWQRFVDEPKRNEMLNLRWATLGYHHDWDTKVYGNERKTEFPLCLKNLTKHIAARLSFENFEPEAAIVNYYHLNSTLSGHTDHSEIDYAAPLFSFSFGRTAIFMIGGLTKSVQPLALYLKSGDIALMTGHSRLCYHGVPKILPATKSEDWDGLFDNSNESLDRENETLKMYLEFSRININVRQVYPSSP